MAKKPKILQRLEDLTPHTENANTGNERGAQAIEDSLRSVGAARSIVVDRNGIILAGNQTHQKAVELGLAARVVETTGEELVVVRRMDVDAERDPEKAKELAYRDNRAGELNLTWDPKQLAADLDTNMLPPGLWTDAEMAHHLKALELEVAEGGAADARAEVDGAGLEASHVRMVQLFLTTETQPQFVAWVNTLGARYGTDSVTDTVYECLKRAADILERAEALIDEAQPV